MSFVRCFLELQSSLMPLQRPNTLHCHADLVHSPSCDCSVAWDDRGPRLMLTSSSSSSCQPPPPPPSGTAGRGSLRRRVRTGPRRLKSASRAGAWRRPMTRTATSTRSSFARLVAGVFTATNHRHLPSPPPTEHGGEPLHLLHIWARRASLGVGPIAAGRRLFLSVRGRPKAPSPPPASDLDRRRGGEPGRRAGHRTSAQKKKKKKKKKKKGWLAGRWPPQTLDLKSPD